MAQRRSPPPPATPPTLGDEVERRLFECEFAGVRPLPPGPTRVAPSASAPGPRGSARAAFRKASQVSALTVERQGSRVTGASFGVSHETLHKLGRGGTRFEATCDLHGLRAEAARMRLERFIAESVALDRRAVLVICGRGVHSGLAGPVLLEMAVRTLGQPPAAQHVLAFASAAPAQGGEGALMVLLRRRRPAPRA